MSVAQSGIPADHWCVKIAREAAWPNADTLRVPRVAAAEEAWAAVVSHCAVSDEVLAGEIARRYRLEQVQWATVRPQATKLLPERFARKHRVFPVREADRSIYVATSD